jgi:hypothetical protein
MSRLSMGMNDLVAALFVRQFVPNCKTCVTKAFDACRAPVLFR